MGRATHSRIVAVLSDSSVVAGRAKRSGERREAVTIEPGARIERRVQRRTRRFFASGALQPAPGPACEHGEFCREKSPANCEIVGGRVSPLRRPAG